MPIYEYRCSNCGFKNEYLQKANEPLKTACPSCGKASFTKLLSAAGFQFKGSGYYATDFKNPVKPAEKKADTKAETKAETAPACGQGACPACTSN